MLRSRQPTILSGMALFGLIVGVEVFVMIFGVVGDRNTLYYTVPFLGVPAFWGWLLFLSYAPMRRAAPSKRLLQVIASACVLGGLLCLLQWGAVLAMSDVITEISDTSSYTFLLSLVIGYTLSEATVLGAIPEEVFKFCLLYLIASREPLPSRYGTVMYAISASLGFVIVSGTWRLLRVFASTEKSEVLIAYFAVETLLISTMQIVAGLWIGLNFTKQRFPEAGQEAIRWWQVLVPPLVFHAVFMGFLAVMFMLYDSQMLHWMVFALICAFSVVLLTLGLGHTLTRAKKLLSDPGSYAPLDIQGEENEFDEYGEDEHDL
jgi:hypothetical protein